MSNMIQSVGNTSLNGWSSSMTRQHHGFDSQAHLFEAGRMDFQKSPAYLFGEKVVRPLIDTVFLVWRRCYNSLPAASSLSNTMVKINHAFTFPSAAAAPLPPDIIGEIRDYIGAMGNTELTKDVIERIVTDKTGQENLDPEIVTKIKSIFSKAIDYAGIVMDPSEFAKIYIGEMESIALERIDKLDKTLNGAYETYFEKKKPPKQEKKLETNKADDNEIEQFVKFFEGKQEELRTMVKLFNEYNKEISQLEEDIQKADTTAREILKEAIEGNEKYENIAVEYSSLKDKIGVGKKLKKSLEEGIGRAEYVLNLYKEECGGELTQKNINRFGKEDQNVINFWMGRLNTQQEMLTDLEPQLVFDESDLDSYVSEATVIPEIILGLEKRLIEVVAKRDAFRRRKDLLEAKIDDITPEMNRLGDWILEVGNKFNSKTEL